MGGSWWGLIESVGLVMVFSSGLMWVVGWVFVGSLICSGLRWVCGVGRCGGCELMFDPVGFWVWLVSSIWGKFFQWRNLWKEIWVSYKWKHFIENTLKTMPNKKNGLKTKKNLVLDSISERTVRIQILETKIESNDQICSYSLLWPHSLPQTGLQHMASHILLQIKDFLSKKKKKTKQWGLFLGST